jgi:hypothetical protein
VEFGEDLWWYIFSCGIDAEVLLSTYFGREDQLSVKGEEEMGWIYIEESVFNCAGSRPDCS